MSSTTIICIHCKKSFEISDAIQHQIETKLLEAEAEQLEILRKETDGKIKQAVHSAVVEANQLAERQLLAERQRAKHELAKAEQTAELEVEKTKQSIELETVKLRKEAESAKESENQLREQLKDLLEELSKANKARENAELTARKELLEKENSFVKKQLKKHQKTLILKFANKKKL